MSLSLTVPGSATPGFIVPGTLDPGMPSVATVTGPAVVFRIGIPATQWLLGQPYIS